MLLISAYGELSMRRQWEQESLWQSGVHLDKREAAIDNQIFCIPKAAVVRCEKQDCLQATCPDASTVPRMSLWSQSHLRKRQIQTIGSFVRMYAHKASISISIAEDGRNSPVRFLGVIPNARRRCDSRDGTRLHLAERKYGGS